MLHLSIMDIVLKKKNVASVNYVLDTALNRTTQVRGNPIIFRIIKLKKNSLKCLLL